MDEKTVTCEHCGAVGEPSHWYCPHDGHLMLGGRALGGDEWVLGDRLGKGGMGAVYRARHRLDGRLAAVKLLGPRVVDNEAAEDVQRFLRESSVRVRHPNCVEIQDVGRTQGIRGPGTALWWIRMDYVEGRSLEDLSAEGPLSLVHLLSLAEQMCAGLHACHKAGIVHRDFKPSNVLVETSTGRPKVADFGIALLLDQPRMTRSNGAPGTPLYMSPEQFRGDPLAPRSDLFALGIVLYELMTGRHPFLERPEMSDFELMGRVTGKEPLPLAPMREAYPSALGDVVLRLLQKNPGDRFESAAAVREALLDLNPVEVRITNRDLGFDVTLSCARGDDLASVRARALEKADLFPVATRILKKAGTRFGWEVKGQRLTDDDTVARACDLAGDARPVELHLRVHPPDVLLGG